MSDVSIHVRDDRRSLWAVGQLDTLGQWACGERCLRIFMGAASIIQRLTGQLRDTKTVIETIGDVTIELRVLPPDWRTRGLFKSLT